MAVIFEFGDPGVWQAMEQFAEFCEFGAGEVENENYGQGRFKEFGYRAGDVDELGEWRSHFPGSLTRRLEGVALGDGCLAEATTAFSWSMPAFQSSSVGGSIGCC